MNYAFLMNVDAQVHLHVLPRYASARWWSDAEFTDPNWGAGVGHEQRVLESTLIGRLARETRGALSP